MQLYSSKRKDNKSIIKFTKRETDIYFKQFDTSEQVKQYIIELINVNIKSKNM